MNTSDKNFLGCESCVWWGKGVVCGDCIFIDYPGNLVHRLYRYREYSDIDTFRARPLPIRPSQPASLASGDWALAGSAATAIIKGLQRAMQANERHPS